MESFLLLQVRNADDPMRRHELECFSRSLHCEVSQIHVFDLLSGVPSPDLIDSVDCVLLGGSGDYSVAEGGPWLPAALEAMRELYEMSKPTFASCWGFQAMAKALGGEVVTDLQHAELGTVEVQLTAAGKSDPLFSPLGDRFLAPMGHQDCVTTLPPNAIRLASSRKVANQAFRIENKPIYCTQFHPELNRIALLQRIRGYPQYVTQITGQTFETFARSCEETPQTDRLLERFVRLKAGLLASSSPTNVPKFNA